LFWAIAGTVDVRIARRSAGAAASSFLIMELILESFRYEPAPGVSGSTDEEKLLQLQD